jgi:flagellar biogenesis protein FliO
VIRLGVAIAILAVVALVVRRAAKTKQAPDAVRVAARAGITRGTVAAVLEVDQRRWLVTVTGSATTVVAELDPHTTAPAPADGEAPAADEGRRAPRRERRARPRRVGRARRVRRARVGLVERARRRTARGYDPDVQVVGGEQP